MNSNWHKTDAMHGHVKKRGIRLRFWTWTLISGFWPWTCFISLNTVLRYIYPRQTKGVTMFGLLFNLSVYVNVCFADSVQNFQYILSWFFFCCMIYSQLYITYISMLSIYILVIRHLSWNVKVIYCCCFFKFHKKVKQILLLIFFTFHFHEGMHVLDLWTFISFVLCVTWLNDQITWLHGKNFNIICI